MTGLVVPVLDADMVRLRPFAASDVDLIIAAGKDPLIPSITSVCANGDEADAREFIRRQHHRACTGQGWSFAIADPGTDTAVGQIGLWRKEIGHGRVSIGYWIERSHRRHGYAGRALRLLSSWGSTLDEVTRLELYVEPWNEGSWRAAESAGYRREGLLRRWQKIDGLAARHVHVCALSGCRLNRPTTLSAGGQQHSPASSILDRPTPDSRTRACLPLPQSSSRRRTRGPALRWCPGSCVTDVSSGLDRGSRV
ncbi:GNAT family N-acetyltransferase (plasmid) [Nocardia sp. NBC_01377]|uniref:GNAT family N-acetyltransferase n=1 Tax=Nocardia sp. NBC_01377 TaxID=2903595 RepID=UPI002F90761E